MGLEKIKKTEAIHLRAWDWRRIKKRRQCTCVHGTGKNKKAESTCMHGTGED
jgi:hypothetical protein